MDSTGSGIRRSPRHLEKRAVLLTAAAKTINAMGAGAINLNDIAAGIGLSRNALYYYVTDRIELVFECYRQTCEVALADLAEAFEASENASDRLRHFITLQLASGRPARAVLSDHDMLPEPQRGIILNLRARQIDGLAAIVSAGMAEGTFRQGDAELVAQTLVGMLSWAQLSSAWLAQRDGPAARRRSAAAVHDLLTGGIAAPGVRLPDFLPLWPRAFNAFDRQAAADAKSEQLIAAASRLFNRRGIDGVSMEEIGASVGATKGAIYHYFADKPVLVETCLERAFDLYESYMDTIVARGGSGFARAITVHHMNSQAQAGAIAPMLLQPGYASLPEPAHSQFIARARRLWRSTAAMITAGIADGSCRSCDAAAVAEVAAGAFFWLPKWREAGDVTASVAIADALSDIAAFGIAPHR
jgi:AcrR family transcriptional regulator